MTGDLEKTVEIHGSEWNVLHVREAIAYCKKSSWEKRSWTCRDALIHRGDARRISLYVGQQYDPTKIDLAKGGWKHDYCEVCWWDMYESDDEEHGIGYTNGNDWMYTECYTKFIVLSRWQIGKPLNFTTKFVYAKLTLRRLPGYGFVLDLAASVNRNL